MQEWCNSELAKDISRWRQHLRFLCILIRVLLLSRMSLHLVDQCVIIIYMFCVNISLHLEECPKVYFPLYLEMKLSVSEADIIFKFVCSMFSKHFYCSKVRQKYRVGKFLVFNSFKSYDYFNEENAYFIKTYQNKRLYVLPA